MIQRLRNRIARSEAEGGFTLIELLVVIIIIGILLAVAVPSYLQFRDRANNSAAQANVRAAVPAVEAFYSDNNEYTGMSVATLAADYDASISDDSLTVNSAGASTYCISNTQGNATAFKDGPAAAVELGTC